MSRSSSATPTSASVKNPVARMSPKTGPLSRVSIARIMDDLPVEGVPDHRAPEGGVVDPGRFEGPGVTRVGADVGVRVDLEDERTALGVHPEVHPGVVPAAPGPERGRGQALEVRPDVVVDGRRANGRGLRGGGL